MMRLFIAIVLFSVLCVAERPTVPGTSVSMEPPPGMAAASRFAGFESTAEGASIMVTEMVAPYAGLTAGFRDAQKLEAQRMTVERIEKANLASGTPVEIFTLKQRYAGIEYRKVILAAGSETRTLLVVATCDMDVAPKWEPLFRSSLMTIVLHQAPAAARAGFRIEPKGPFREARAVSGTVAYTVDGVFPLPEPGAPLFLATRSVAPVPVSSLEQLAQTRAKSLPGVKEFRATDSKSIRLDGLEGHELTGVSNKGAVYLIVLREPDGGYYVLIGSVADTTAATYLPLFREMAASFTRR